MIGVNQMSQLHKYMSTCRTEICNSKVSVCTKALFSPHYSNLLKRILRIQSKYGVIWHSSYKARSSSARWTLAKIQVRQIRERNVTLNCIFTDEFFFSFWNKPVLSYRACPSFSHSTVSIQLLSLFQNDWSKLLHIMKLLCM